MTRVEVRVPGFVYFECLDPFATEFPREHPEIGTPTVHRVGRGRQYRYDVTREIAETIIDHAETFGEAISFGVDDPSAGRRVLRWTERERERLDLRRTT